MGGQGSGGHNRKSAEEHRLAGTFRASRHGLRAVDARVRPEPEAVALVPPDGLSPAAIDMWRRFVTAFPSRFGDNLPALTVLETLVRAADRHREAREIIDRDGVLVEGSGGAQRAHPLLRAERTTALDMLKALQSLRLDAAAELATLTEAEVDPFDEFEGLSPLARIQRKAQRRGGRGQ